MNTQRIFMFSKQHGYSEESVHYLFIIFQAELIALQQEKEAALQQCKKLEEEMERLHVYYR